MPTIPQFQTGKHLISLVVTGQAIGTAGAMSDSTSTVTLSAVVRSVGDDFEVERAEINAMNTTRRNEVVISDGANFSVDVLKVNNGSDPQPLRTLYFSFDYYKVVKVEGTGGSQKTSTAYYVRGNYSDKFEGRAEQIAHLELGPCDPGQAQVSVA